MHVGQGPLGTGQGICTPHSVTHAIAPDKKLPTWHGPLISKAIYLVMTGQWDIIGDLYLCRKAISMLMFQQLKQIDIELKIFSTT